MYDPDKECRAMLLALKRLCEEKNITPYALARKAGVSTSTISYLMSGKTKPQFYTILALCDALEVPVGALFEAPCGKGGQTAGEERLLDCYRDLSERKRAMLWTYADMLRRYDDKFLRGGVYGKTEIILILWRPRGPLKLRAVHGGVE